MITLPAKLFSKRHITAFKEKYPRLYRKFVFVKIKKAIELNQSEAILFKVEDSEFVGKISQNKYAIILSKLLDQFISAEDYELAKECNEVYIKYKIEDLIKSV